MVDLIKLGDLEICLLSFNLGNYFKSLLTKYNNIKTDFVRLFKPGKNRIWVITTQEDKIDSQFMKNIQTYFNSLGGEYTQLSYFGTDSIADKTFKEHIGVKGSSFKNKIVKISVFIPTILSPHISLFNHPIVVKHSHLLNKSSLIVSLVISGTVDTQYPTLISFIGSHLPIDTKQDFKLGVDKRIKAIQECLDIYIEKVQEEFAKHNSQQATTHLLWTGDLNFRLEEYGNLKSDQLMRLINSNDLPLRLTDFTPIDKIGATCKTITEKYIDDNETPLLENNNLSNNSGTKFIKSRCHDLYKGIESNPELVTKCYDVFVKRKEIKKRLGKHTILSSKIRQKGKSLFERFLKLKTKKNSNNTRSLLSNNYSNTSSNTALRRSLKNNTSSKNTMNNKSQCWNMIEGRAPITEEAKKCFHEIEIPSHQKAFSTMRFPSYCDRILGHSTLADQIELQPVFIPELNIDDNNRRLAVRPLVSLNFISISDHNPMFGTFKFLVKAVWNTNMQNNNENKKLDMSLETWV